MLGLLSPGSAKADVGWGGCFLGTQCIFKYL